FRVNDGVFLIGEIRYNQKSLDQNTTYRLGGGVHSERVRDLRLDSNWGLLASPLSSGPPLLHHKHFSVDGSIDQPFFHDKEANDGINATGRVMIAPSDRNLIDLYVDAGLTYSGPFHRGDDKVGIAIGHARVGSAARSFDADVAKLTGFPYPIRSAETVVE